MATLETLNTELWIFCLLLLAVVCCMSLLFVKNALKFNKKFNVMSKEELKQCVTVGSVSVIGPALSVIVIMLGLMNLVSAPIALMRVGVIGSAMSEMQAANLAAATLGLTLGESTLDVSAVATIIFTMVTGSIGYIIWCLVALKPMDTLAGKSVGKKKSFLPIMGVAASTTVLLCQSLNMFVSGKPYIAAFIGAAVVAYIVKYLAKKTGNRKLNDWLLTLGLLAGMACGAIFA